MPKEFTDCVKGIMKNPKFKPQKGRTKKDSAYAICTKRFVKKHGISPAEHDKKSATSSIVGFLNFYDLLRIVRGK